MNKRRESFRKHLKNVCDVNLREYGTLMGININNLSNDEICSEIVNVVEITTLDKLIKETCRDYAPLDDEQIEILYNDIRSSLMLFDKTKPINVLSLFTGNGYTEMLLMYKFYKAGYNLNEIVLFDREKSTKWDIFKILFNKITHVRSLKWLNSVVEVYPGDYFTFAISVNKVINTSAKELDEDVALFKDFVNKNPYIVHYDIVCSKKYKCNIRQGELGDLDKWIS